MRFFVFKWWYPFLHIQRFFQDSFIFGEATSSHFFRVTASTQPLLFWNRYVFWAAAFVRSSVFERVVSLQQLFFSEYLNFSERKSYVSQQPLFWREELIRIKLSREKLLCRNRYFCTASTFSEKLHLRKT